MNLYNGKISRRINEWIRTNIVVPTKRRKLEKKDMGVIENCKLEFLKIN